MREGLIAIPRTIPATNFHDARGSRLFDEVTRLPEHYPIRTGRAILDDHAREVALATEARTLVGLGSGTLVERDASLLGTDPTRTPRRSSTAPCGCPSTTAPTRWWTDVDGDFGLSLSVPA